MFTTAVSCYSRFWTNDLNFRLMSEQELINYFIQTGACHYLKYDSIRKVRVGTSSPSLDGASRMWPSSNVADVEIRSIWTSPVRDYYVNPLRFTRLHLRNLMLILYFMAIILMSGM